MTILDQYKQAIKGPWTTYGLAVDYNITEYADAIWVSFNGTCFPDNKYKWFDLLVDLDFWPTNFHPNGFYQAYLSSFNQIEDDIKYFNPNKKVIYTGFSLGGAMASIFASHNRNRFAVTFGAPHTSWGIKFITNKNIIHYAIPNDPIVYLAPWWWGFYHPGRTVWLDWADAPMLDKDTSKCSHMQYLKVLERMQEEEDLKALQSQGVFNETT